VGRPRRWVAWLELPSGGAGGAAAAGAMTQFQTMMPPAPVLPYDFSTSSSWGAACRGRGVSKQDGMSRGRAAGAARCNAGGCAASRRPDPSAGNVRRLCGSGMRKPVAAALSSTNGTGGVRHNQATARLTGQVEFAVVVAKPSEAELARPAEGKAGHRGAL
jgi:hypothetical protein